MKTPHTPLFAWTLFVLGILATAYAWQTRQPATTSDFTLFYISAQNPPARMYERPVGPPRANMNPPHFQLLMKPFSRFPLPVATALWRGVNLLSLCLCLWWIARSSGERWDLADIGALMTWTPMAMMLNLNQVTWFLWPLLVWTWWCWRQERWTAGSIGYGIALSLKPFLGVFLLWLVIKRRWNAAAASMASAALSVGVGIAVYGFDVFHAWTASVGTITWWSAGMNASLQGLLARILTAHSSGVIAPLVTAPSLIRPLAIAGAVLIVGATLWHTRAKTVDESWPLLMVSALLASPLGWLYYAWWLVPGTRPSRLLMESPLLWIPFAYVTVGQPNGWVTVTLGSVYFWAVFMLWARRIGLASMLRRPLAAALAPSRRDVPSVA